MSMPPKDTLLDYYKQMLLIRYFEEQIEALFGRGLVKGTAHPAIGQEAIAVGACNAIRKSDYVTSTHRGHGHLIASGGDPRRIMAELFGKKTGYSGGRGGSQLMADLRLGFLGSNGITGAGIPLATGVALSLKRRKADRVVICFFGDGAANQGTFHESLNMAAIWKLPIVYVCENNMYAMSTAVSDACGVEDIAIRAASYGFEGFVVDGNDVLAVRHAVREAAGRARRREGPTLLECKTYRLSGHSRGDPRRYRSREEEQLHMRAEPLGRFRKFLRSLDFLPREEDSRLRREARQEVKTAVTFARNSDDPDPATLTEGVYA